MEKDSSREKENLHENHRQRVWDRLERDGLDSFYDHEVIELILFYTVPRRDTNPIAHRLINEFGSLSAVMDADIEALRKVRGVSEKSAVLLKLIPSLIRRYSLDRVKPMTALGELEKASQYAINLMTGENHEVFYMLCMDSKNRLLKAEKLKEGSPSEIVINLRAVVMAAAGNKAAGVILTHNHPRGSSMPSVEDMTLTQKAALALGLIGIPVLDHIIVAENETFSFKREGLMDEVIKSVASDIKGEKEIYI